MADQYVRFKLDLSISRTAWLGLTPARKQAVRDRLMEMKNAAKRINEGNPLEEDSVKVVWHL